MELGLRLKQARLDAGLSQRQLCGEVITRNMLSQIENGSARPSMDTLQYLAKQLGKPVSFFLEETTASVNQTRMEAARAAFSCGQYTQALSELTDYRSADAVFDAEYYLLQALSLMELAAQTPDKAKELLSLAAEAGAHTPYYTADLERRRLLLLIQRDPHDATLLSRLPDDELLIRAEAALAMGNTIRCQALLDAAADHGAARWLILRGDCAMASEDFQAAAAWYCQADDPAAYPKLESCYLKLEDYKMAYYYACKQR